MNTFGTRLRFTGFGESHGPAVGGVLDGMPAGMTIDFDLIYKQLSRRRTGQDTCTSARREADEVEFLSGIYEGRTLGTPIAFLIRNTDCRPADYEALSDIYRPSHADYTYQMRYGLRDPRGGGRASARETAARVVAGALAEMWLNGKGVTIEVRVLQIGPYAAHETAAIQSLLDLLKTEGDTVGGIVGCTVQGMPAGVGDPVFGKLQSRLAAAMLSINACKGFDYGSGFDGVGKTGSELNDPFTLRNGQVRTLTNHSGGILGGITNGEDICFRCVFKPASSIRMEQHTVRTDGTPTTITIGGRHDVCFLPRVLPVVEAMTALTCADALL